MPPVESFVFPKRPFGDLVKVHGSSSVLFSTMMKLMM